MTYRRRRQDHRMEARLHTKKRDREELALYRAISTIDGQLALSVPNHGRSCIVNLVPSIPTLTEELENLPSGHASGDGGVLYPLPTPSTRNPLYGSRGRLIATLA